jgi:hypothetical protein
VLIYGPGLERVKLVVVVNVWKLKNNDTIISNKMVLKCNRGYKKGNSSNAEGQEKCGLKKSMSGARKESI